jgi:tRNA(Arg) A34 adenosine deaminase TadA
MNVLSDTSIFLPAIPYPEWLRRKMIEIQGVCLSSVEERLLFVHALAEQNVSEHTGSPFGAAVFHGRTHELVGVGVNQVVQAGQSFAHAEMMALANAHERLQMTDLTDYELVSSCEPCVMCTGGFLWSKVSTLVYGELGITARSIGFDEGDKPANWEALLRQRGRQVLGPFPSEQGKLPFDHYKARQGKIY